MPNSLLKSIDPSKYILSFKANGVSVFVTDIHRNVYFEMEVVFIIDHGAFGQYFPEKTFQKALNRGLNFYKNNTKFDKYVKNLRQHKKNFQEFFKK